MPRNVGHNPSEARPSMRLKVRSLAPPFLMTSSESKSKGQNCSSVTSLTISALPSRLTMQYCLPCNVADACVSTSVKTHSSSLVCVSTSLCGQGKLLYRGSPPAPASSFTSTPSMASWLKKKHPLQI